jgi:hypothetical protein
VCPDDGAVDHVSGGISLHHFGQRFEYCIEDAERYPSPISSKNAVPLAVLVGKVPPLRTGPSNPHHAFEIQAVILSRAATATALRRQQRADDHPFPIRKTYPFAQRCLQKSALNQ